MNRKQLERLHQLGLIGDVAYTAALAQLRNGKDVRPRLSALHVPSAVRLSVDPTARTISGTASVYGQLVPSHGMILEPGCLNSRQPLNKNKMLIDHDQRQPVGFLASVDEGTLDVTYSIPEGPEGDAALDSATKGLRDGLSVGFTALEYFFDEEYVIHVTAADWYETSLCAIPAIADAGVTNVAAAVATTEPKGNPTVNRAQLAAALAAGTISQEAHDAALATLEAVEASLAVRPDAPAAQPAQPVNPEQANLNAIADGPAAPEHPRVEVRQRDANLATIAQRISAGVRSGEFTAVDQIGLAIGEFLPAQDAGEAFTRPEWLGELRTLAKTDRPWVDAIGSPLPLNSLKAEGWRWDEEPDVDELSVDTLDEVSGNDPTTEGDAFKAFGIAAAHRVKRSVVDFADPQFTTDFLAARYRRYLYKSNAGIRARMLAAATAPAGTVAEGGVVAVMKQLVKDVRAVGGRLNRIFLDNTLYEELEDLDVGPTATLPLWLRQASIGINLADATADVAGVAIVNDSALAAGQAVGFDNSIVDVRESPVIQISAVAVSFAAVDLGLYGYMRLDDHDPRGIVKRTYVEA